MGTDAQAEKPEAKAPENSDKAGQEAAKDDSGLNEQQKKEWMALKQKAEAYNKLEQELAAERAERERLSRIAYAGNVQATDPAVEAYQQTLAQAEFDPVARLTVLNAQKAVKAEAESWLANELLSVPENKRKQVAGIIRANAYQVSAESALNLVTDPETKTLAEQLEATKAELERLKNAKPNATSPASVVPASASADDGATQTNMKMSDYVAALERAKAEDASDAERARARALKQAAGSNKLKLERD